MTTAPIRKPLDVTTLPLPPEAEAAIAADRLNRAQAAAVYAPLAPTLLLGPPGTGKTKSATDRIGHYLDLGMPADALFVGTFTQASAIEITTRVDAAHAGRFRPRNPNDQLMVGTLNSLGLRILRALERNGAIKANKLMRGSEPRDLCRRLDIDLRTGNRRRRTGNSAAPVSATGTPPALSAPSTGHPPPPAPDKGWFGAGFGGSDGLDLANPAAPPSRGAQILQSLIKGKTPAAILLGQVHDLPFLDVVSRWKERLITPSDAVKIATGAAGSNATADDVLARLAHDYAKYVAAQRDAQLIDFSDQIALPVLLLKENPKLLAAFQNRWKAVIVDEYQDVNTALGALVDLLAGGHRNLWCVGDPDQTLYGFRGSDPNYILQFQDRWPDAQVIALTENYRCRPTIVAAANRLIRNNKDRYETFLTATRPEVVLPDPIGRALSTPSMHRTADQFREVAIEVVAYPDDLTESQDIARKVRGLVDAGVPATEIAILCRVGYRSYHITQALRGQGIPIRILKGNETAEPVESQLVDGLLRGAHYPATGPGYTDADTLKRLLSAANSYEAMKAAATQLRAAREAGTLPTWSHLCDAVRDMLFAAVAEDTTSSPAAAPAPATPVPTTASDDAAPPISRAEARILSAVQAAITAGSYDAWCAAASVQPVPATTRNPASRTSGPGSTTAELPGITVTTLGTIHGSKGLEFDHVFLPGFENDISPAEGDAANEEERRLAYVAMTRARDTLTVSHAIRRAGDRYAARPSCYIDEALFGTPGIAWTDYADPNAPPAPTLDLDALEAAGTRNPPSNSTPAAATPPFPAAPVLSGKPPQTLPPTASSADRTLSGNIRPAATAEQSGHAGGAPWPAQTTPTPPTPTPITRAPLDLPPRSPFSTPTSPAPSSVHSPAHPPTQPATRSPAPPSAAPPSAVPPKAVPAAPAAFTLRVDGGGDECTPWRVTLTNAAGQEIYRSLVNPAGNWLTLVVATQNGVDPTLLHSAPQLDVVAENILITLERARRPNHPRPLIHLPDGLSSLDDLGLSQHLTTEAFDIRPAPPNGG